MGKSEIFPKFFKFFFSKLLYFSGELEETANFFFSIHSHLYLTGYLTSKNPEKHSSFEKWDLKISTKSQIWHTEIWHTEIWHILANIELCVCYWTSDWVGVSRSGKRLICPRTIDLRMSQAHHPLYSARNIVVLQNEIWKFRPNLKIPMGK